MADDNTLTDSLISSEPKNGITAGSYYLALVLFVVVFIQIIIGRKRLFAAGRDNAKRGIEPIPGPKPLPLIGNVLSIYPMTETINVTAKWCRMYGPCLKVFGPFNKSLVLLSSAEQVEALLKSTDLGHLIKMPLVYDLMKPFFGNGVAVSSGKLWRMQRKVLLKSMSFQSLRSYTPIVNIHCKRLTEALDRLFADGQVHPINDLISITFLDVICEIVTGVGLQNSSEGVEYHHNFQIWKKCIMYRLLHPWFIPSPIGSLHPMSRKNHTALDSMFDFVKRRIAMHKMRSASRREDRSGNYLSNPSSPPFRTVLDDLVDAKMSDDQIIGEVNSMIFGGHETGAGAVHFLCMCLALNPDIQEMCQKEADAIFDDPKQFQNGQLVFDSLANLKYVKRTVLETLRLYPPGLVFFRQLQVQLKVELNGEAVEIPTGTDVAIYSFALHRKEEYFPNPERFDPDRHLPQETAKRPAYSFVPFSMGPRNCLGLKFAMIELKTIAAYLVRNFHIHTTDRLEDVKLLPSITLTPERDFNFIFKRRTMSHLK